jgi:signal transduction histidine kinase
VRVTAEPNGLLRADVIDTGIGIASEHQERIFEEFVQVEGPHQRRVTGTGLGLPLSRRLAALLGGHLELVSAPGAGSTFSVIVPRFLRVASGHARAGLDEHDSSHIMGRESPAGEANG